MDQLDELVRRLGNIGISIKMVSNYPWIYLYRVNNYVVTEKFDSNHGFTIGFYNKDGSIYLSNISEIFKIVRKYNEITIVK